MNVVPASDTPAPAEDPKTLPPLPLPPGVTARFVDTQSLNFYVLESVPPQLAAGLRPPLIVLVHGFPELAFSWRYILPLLAAKGYYAVAFDQRGYGRTHHPALKPIPAESFRPLSLIKDTVALVHALGYDHVSCLVGHDFGAVTATYCALSRPDFFHKLVLMSHPFKGVPQLPFNSSPNPALPSPANPPQPTKYDKTADPDIHNSMASLPNPRKHYKWYYCTAPSTAEMTYPTGHPLHVFLRGYFHLKSGDWNGNFNPSPHPLASWTATELEKMPHYYIMPRDATMREAVAINMTKEGPLDQLNARWLPDKDLAVYVSEYGRNTFQGGLNWYRIQTNPIAAADVYVLAGTKFSIPTKFIAGVADWGIFQEPGAVEALEQGRSVHPNCYKGTVIVEGAGHWVNQEQPERCVKEIIDMLDSD